MSKPITLDNLKALTPNEAIYIPRAGKSPERWRVNGAVKVWKRDASRVRVPVKHGLYAYDAVTEAEIGFLVSREAFIDHA